MLIKVTWKCLQFVQVSPRRGGGGRNSTVIHVIENAQMYVMLIITTCSASSMLQPSWENHTLGSCQKMSTLFFSPDAITFLEDRLLWIPRENTIKPSENGFGDGNRFGTSLRLLQSSERPIAPPCPDWKGKAEGNSICVIPSLINKIQIGSTWFDCLWFLLIRALKPSFSQRLMLLDNLEQCVCALQNQQFNPFLTMVTCHVTNELTAGIRRCLSWAKNKDVRHLYIKNSGKLVLTSVACKQRKCVTRISAPIKKSFHLCALKWSCQWYSQWKLFLCNPLFSFILLLGSSFCFL